MKTRRLTAGLLSGTLILGFAATLPAAPPASFSLGKAVPADSWIYVHVAPNPEREFLDKHWSHVWEEVANLHLERDIRQLLIPPGETPEANAEIGARWDKAMELCKGVAWKELVAGEIVVFSRWDTLPEFHMLLKPGSESVEQHTRGLAAILDELASLDPSMKVTKSTIDGAQVWTLSAETSPLALHMFQHAGVIGFSLGGSVEAMLTQLGGEGGEHRPLISSDRFKKAAAAVAPPEDSIFFVDIAKIFQTAHSLLSPPADTPKDPAGGKDPVQPDVAEALMAELNFLDYAIITEQTQGLNTTKHTLLQVQEGGSSKQLCKAVMRTEPIAGFERYIPEDATAFTAWNGVNVEGLYDFILDFVRKNVPDGQQSVASWEQMQAEMGFSLKADVFSWLDGQFGFIGLPAAMPTPFATDDLVLMLRVKDRTKALGTIEKQLARLGQALIVTPAADVSAPDFKSVVYAPMAMMGKLTYGVHDQWLVLSIGSSSAAVNKCIAVATGQAKGFKETERASKMEMKFDQPLVFVSFQDLRKAFQQTAQMAGMLPMFAAMGVPPTPDNQKILAVFNVIGKLPKAISKIDFMLDYADTCTFKDGSLKCKTLMTHASYVPPSERTTQPQGDGTKKTLDGL